MQPGVDGMQALERLQQRLRLALDAGHLCTLDYDVLLDRIECSGNTDALAGSTLESLHGSLATWLSQVQPDERPRVQETIAQAIDHGDELCVEARVTVAGSRRS